MQSKQLIVLVGPTAVGKTSVALQLANHFKTEIISADSRQIYKELEIGTAKPTNKELNQIKHHFINSHSIGQTYDAGSYEREAVALIGGLFNKFDKLILCGGSGLYIKAVLEGFDEMPVIPAGTREKIMTEYEAKGLHWLQEQVRQFDPEYFNEVDSKNPYRLIRALELYAAEGKPVSALRTKRKSIRPFETIKIGLEVTREELYRRIDLRMDVMIAAGLFEEAEKFFPQRQLNSLQTVGYREIFGYLENQYDREEAIRLLKRNSRRYAKRQLTWFKRDQETKWFNPNQINEMINLIES